MAALPADFTLSGVLKSGSPALKSTTLNPARRRRSASAATLRVADTDTCASLFAKLPILPPSPLSPDHFLMFLPHPLLDLRRHQAAHFPAEPEDFLDQP